MQAIFPRWMKSSDKKMKKIVNNAVEAETYQKEIDKYEASLGKKTGCSGGKKQDETPTQPTPGENQGGEAGSNGPTPITTDDFANKTNAQLIAFLVEKGQDEKELKKLKKDQLIARIGELGK